MTSVRSCACAAAMVAAGVAGAASLPGWPYAPHGQSYALGNNYGAFQRYDGGEPYVHDGVDILAGARRPVFALRDGTVTYLVNDSDLYSGVVVGDPRPGGAGWLYWHLDRGTIRPALGEQVLAGEYLGDVVDWPVKGFDHIHVSKVRGETAPPWLLSVAVGDPLEDLAPADDRRAPTIEMAADGETFLFSANESDRYLPPTALSGQVDIVARAYDRFDGSAWRLAPYSLRWSVADASGAIVARGAPLVLDGELGPHDTVVKLLYKGDGRAQSKGDYEQRAYFLVATNGHEPRPFGAGHGAGALDTTPLANGAYTVMIEARDRRGNAASARMAVRVKN